MLFNLKADPGEAYNLADRYPQRVNVFKEKMMRWEEQLLRDPIGRLRLA